VLLKKTEIVLKESLREGIDTPAVLDENTLAVILPETPPETAVSIAERLNAELEARAFESLAPELKMSAGVVSCPFHRKEENELMKNAFLSGRISCAYFRFRRDMDRFFPLLEHCARRFPYPPFRKNIRTESARETARCTGS
jgi:hypothetical protein